MRQIQLEGVTITAEDASVATTGIKPGDIYIAKRNTGWKLLTCKELHTAGPGRPWVIPEEMEYSYDDWEYYKVISFG